MMRDVADRRDEVATHGFIANALRGFVRGLCVPLWRLIVPANSKPTNLQCIGCGYDLAATPPRFPCPECVTPIAHSKLPLCYFDPAMLRTFKIGYLLLLLGLVGNVLQQATGALFGPGSLHGTVGFGAIVFLNYLWSVGPLVLGAGVVLCLQPWSLQSRFKSGDRAMWPRVLLRSLIITWWLYYAVLVLINGAKTAGYSSVSNLADWVFAWQRALDRSLPIDSNTLFYGVTLITAHLLVYSIARRAGRRVLAAVSLRVAVVFVIGWVTFMCTHYPITNPFKNLWLVRFVFHARFYSSIVLLGTWVAVLIVAVWLVRDCLRWRTLKNVSSMNTRGRPT